jgi:hypothetical protein
MNIEFAEHLKLSGEQRTQVLEWPSMLRHLGAREKGGFPTDKVVINGVSFVGNTQKILLTQARVHYKNPGKQNAPYREGSYHVNFMPDAASLLLAFRVVDQQVNGDRKLKLSDYHVLMVEQPRWGANTLKSLEIPAGITDEITGKFDLVDMKHRRKGAWREFAQETGVSGEASSASFVTFGPDDIKSLGGPLTLHPANTDAQYPFYAEKDCTSAQLAKMKTVVNELSGIDPNESTKPKLIPLSEALQETLESGSSPWSAAILMRFAKIKGLTVEF